MTGKGSGSHRDTSSAVEGPAWVQPGFIAPEHVVIQTQVLYDVAKATGRYQIEVSNPVTKELLAMRSCPFVYNVTLEHVCSLADAWALYALQTLGLADDPF